MLGIKLMPWQRELLDVALELEGGRLVFRDVSLTWFEGEEIDRCCWCCG